MLIPALSRKPARLAAYVLLLVATLLATAAGAAEPDWALFKQRFIEPSGRVVDSAQDNISHSEGQGFAMLFATHFNDRATFDQLWQWTRQNLQVRDDALLAWRWHPRDGVTDKNNASDGDLLVAWALLRAHEKWRAPEYLADSKKIAKDIRGKLFRQAPQGLVLLPGVDGFDKDGLTVNLSYWVFPALREIGRADPAPEWETVTKTGLTLLQYAHFGRWGLPPDWLKLEEKVVPTFSNRFGYDAVRIPLYLLWDHRETNALLQPYREFWSYFSGARFLPSWTSFQDDCVDSFDATPGIHGIAQWVLDYPHFQRRRLPPLDDRHGYYSAALQLLTSIALAERGAP